MKLDVEKSLKLIGFTEKENVPHSLLIGEGSIFFVVDNETHSTAFTSLVHAMYRLDVVALARRVYSKAFSPKLGVLIPRIKVDHVSLVFSEIAFGEDIRSYSFPNFFKTDKSSSQSTLFTDKQISAVDELIDQMMLIETVDKEIKKELYKPSTIRNPAIQYYYQCVQHRFLKPNDNLPDLSENILSTLKPPADKMHSIQDVIDSIKENFPLKTKVTTSKKKHLGEILSEEETILLKKSKLNSEDNVLNNNNLLLNKVINVGSVNPVNDFFILLHSGKITNAISEMENRIWQLVNDSYLTTFYNKAISCLQELRKQSIEYSKEELNLVDKFNQFLENMKNVLTVNSSKNDFWKLVIQENVLPISEKESTYSSLSTDEKKCLLVNPDVFSDMNSDEDLLFDDM